MKMSLINDDDKNYYPKWLKEDMRFENVEMNIEDGPPKEQGTDHSWKAKFSLKEQCFVVKYPLIFMFGKLNTQNDTKVRH